MLVKHRMTPKPFTVTIDTSLKEALERSPTRNVLTECAACKMQIEHISDCIVNHPIKILAGCYQ